MFATAFHKCLNSNSCFVCGCTGLSGTFSFYHVERHLPRDFLSPLDFLSSSGCPCAFWSTSQAGFCSAPPVLSNTTDIKLYVITSKAVLHTSACKGTSSFDDNSEGRTLTTHCFRQISSKSLTHCNRWIGLTKFWLRFCWVTKKLATMTSWHY